MAPRCGRAPVAKRVLTAALFLVATVAGVTSVSASTASDTEAAATPRWLTLGALAGTAGFDPHLADYQWNTAPRAAWGAQLLAGRGRWGAGVRAWNAGTTQHVAGADNTDPGVHATSVELVASGRLLSRWNTCLEARAMTGRLHLGYTPDHVAISGSGGSAVEVALNPVDAWTTGGGLAIRRPLGAGWGAAVEVDARSYAIDTAHRSGAAIVVGPERFDEWGARIELARLYGRP